MSNQNFLTNKRNTNAFASVNNTNAMVRAIQSAIETTGTEFTPTFSNVALTGKTTAYQLEVADKTTLKDVNITGVVTGLTLNGVVTDTRFNSYTSDLSSRLNNIEAYASTTRSNAESSNSAVSGRVSLLESGLAAAKQQTDKVPGIESSILRIDRTIGDNTGGLVLDSLTLNTEVKPNLSDARIRLSALEQTVNGVDVTTGLSRSVTSLETRTTRMEQDVNQLKTDVDGVSGLKNRLTSVETDLSNFNTDLNNRIINLIGDQVPEQFDTLREIADQLNASVQGSVLEGVLSQISTKANTADALIKGVENSTTARVRQDVFNPVRFEGDVTGTGLKAIHISATDTPLPNDSSSVAAKLRNRVDLDSVQEITGSKAFVGSGRLLVPDANSILFGSNGFSGSYQTLQEKLSQTNISSTQNFTNGLTVPTFNSIKISPDQSVNPNQALGDEVYSRLDTRLAAGQPEVNSAPVFKQGFRILDPQKVFLGTQSTIGDTLFATVDRSLTNQTNIANLNNSLAGYTSLSGSQTLESGIKTFAQDAFVVIDPSNLTFRSPPLDTSTTPVSLTTLLGRDRVMYLTGTDTQEVAANKKFSGSVDLNYNSLKVSRTKDSIAATLDAKDFLMNILDNQSITGTKTFTGTGAIALENADQLQVGNKSLAGFAVTTENTGYQVIGGAKRFDADVRVLPSNLKFMTGGPGSLPSQDTDAATYIVNTTGAQDITGKKNFSGSSANGLIVAPSKLFFQTDATTQYTGAEYLVNRVDSQTVGGKKTFSSGVVLPMDTTDLKVSAGDLSSVAFKDYVASKTDAQTISGATTFNGNLLVSRTNLLFKDAGNSSFADFANSVVYTAGNQTLTGKKKFEAEGTIEVAPTALYVKDADVNGGVAQASTSYFMDLYTNQSVLGTKDFGMSGKATLKPSNLQMKTSSGATPIGADAYFMTTGVSNPTEAEQTIASDKKFTGKVTVDSTNLVVGSSTFANWLSTTNLMYLAEQQTVTGNKSFTGNVDVDGSKVKVRKNSSETAENAQNIFDAFVYTSNTGQSQTINGDKNIHCNLDFPLNANYKIRIPVSQLQLYTSGDPFSQQYSTTDLKTINDKTESNETRLGALEESWFDEYKSIVEGLVTNQSNFLNKSSGEQVVASTVKIPSSQLQLTDDNSTYYAASTFLRTGKANNLANTSLTVSSENIVLSDQNNATLSSKFGQYFPLSQNAEIELSSATLAVPSTVKWSNDKKLSVRDTNVLLRTSDSDTTGKQLPTYLTDSFDARLTFHLGSNTGSKQLVSKTDADITFNAGTTLAKQRITLGTNTDLKIESTANLLIGSSDLQSALLKKLDVPPDSNYILASTVSNTYLTKDSASNLYLAKGGGSMSGALALTSATFSSTATFSGTCTFDNLLTSTRTIEKFPSIPPTLNANEVTVNLSSAGVFVLASALTAAGTLIIDSSTFSTPITSGNSHSFAVLIPFAGTTNPKFFFTTVKIGTSTTLTTIVAGGSTNVDLTLTNASTSVGTSYILQTFTVFARPTGTQAGTGAICLTSVALFV